MLKDKHEVLSQLKKDLLFWQGFRRKESHMDSIGLGPLEAAFPNGVFPTGSIHEFISTCREESAVSSGFISGLLAKLMKNGGVCIWISSVKALFPPSIKTFGVEPDRIIFVYTEREKDVLWATEEALKCEGIAAVIAELQELDFVQSRRLQLAVEKSGVTGFVLRSNPRRIGATACVARWRISSLSSELEEGLPGVGFPRWEVELLKVRNGNPGTWKLEWSEERFVPVTQSQEAIHSIEQGRKSG
ncbi:Error-prone repair protein ImuA [Olivibacter sp. SDN3]|uniref:ImuA family protein n=1 Tax=Olivibacter sp. SDN3 TaxID=2764720 RepID=UPI0016515C6A|nr:Error-prone repair protein ImuA [Olivibacter sp. SDN3]QNL48729.1 Error-prone repair protein ImuA [Olivibacter sp. SDN3]